MKRNIVVIDREKCNGCGLCINACQEGALQLVNGKVELITDSYCDGLGACLPECPQGAITLEEREAAAFDEEAVKTNLERQNAESIPPQLECGCAGTHARTIKRKKISVSKPIQSGTTAPVSELRQWPCQIKLVPVNAPYLDQAQLLIAADCTAYAYGNIHQDFMKNKITLIGCPKLDEGDYTAKLTQILQQNEILGITILRMEVPCCGGIVQAVKQALLNSGIMIPWQVVTIRTDGTIIKD
ncbi:MAG: 4Fe-4S binding protein [Desulfitobacteriaceae bacterium]|nr:4Fe-4S binding protein [Desulfitobacteriaceae bacterium]MDD4345888.1 4Fe-4S binding protein [Desulfitobacteriaceae bacterium]MDD4401781.1 4Fe-4S binding protein [Desulfitobacteriaceae bacterium]